ncbi:hypothetical protein [Flavobacterium lindanitolerans]|uniref:hypothetical protein n=1 Tax=Flavobacterium lindanitolerans TaxID=428988 RepID=UPI0030B81530
MEQAGPTSKKEDDNLPSAEEHNDRITRALDYLISGRPTFGIIDKGRTSDERSLIWVENGHFFGMGYIPMDIGLSDISEARDYLTRYATNRYMMQLIETYAQNYPGKIVRPTVTLQEQQEYQKHDTL